MKSYTDIEQSKKLAEILPIESADMAWYSSFAKEGYSIRTLNDTYPLDIIVEIPAWSLAALMELLPNSDYVTTTLSIGIYDSPEDKWKVEYENVTDLDNYVSYITTSYTTIDAVFEMIVWLKENGKLL